MSDDLTWHESDGTADQTGLDPDYEARGAVNPYNANLAQDDLEGLGAGTTANSPQEALAEALRYSREGVYVGTGYCLRAVRSYFGIAALFPDAETAWEEANVRHKTSNPDDIPKGRAVFWVNGGYGHVALSAGGGRCWTTDYRRNGYVDLAPIASLGPWCGGRLVGYTEDVNEVSYMPAKPVKGKDKPKTKRLLSVKFKLTLIDRALDNAVKNEQHQRARALRDWREQLRNR